MFDHDLSFFHDCVDEIDGVIVLHVSDVRSVENDEIALFASFDATDDVAALDGVGGVDRGGGNDFSRRHVH